MSRAAPTWMGRWVGTMNDEHRSCPAEDQVVWEDEQVTELRVLLPRQQAAELEKSAHSRGLTLGQLIRLLIRDYLADRSGAAPIRDPEGTGDVVVQPDVRFDLEELIRSRGIV